MLLHKSQYPDVNRILAFILTVPTYLFSRGTYTPL